MFECRHIADGICFLKLFLFWSAVFAAAVFFRECCSCEKCFWECRFCDYWVFVCTWLYFRLCLSLFLIVFSPMFAPGTKLFIICFYGLLVWIVNLVWIVYAVERKGFDFKYGTAEFSKSEFNKTKFVKSKFIKPGFSAAGRPYYVQPQAYAQPQTYAANPAAVNPAAADSYMQQPVSGQPAAWRAYCEQNQAAQSSELSSEQSAVGNRVRQSSSEAAASEGNFSETDSDAADSAETSNSDWNLVLSEVCRCFVVKQPV